MIWNYKYNIGEEVWIMYKNNIRETNICGIRARYFIEKNNIVSVHYTGKRKYDLLVDNGIISNIDEDKIFKTKKDLIQSL